MLDACRVRLRPVLMTSVAFIMGVVPLVLSRTAPAPRCATRWASRCSPGCSASPCSACADTGLLLVDRSHRRLAARARRRPGGDDDCSRGRPLIMAESQQLDGDPLWDRLQFSRRIRVGRDVRRMCRARGRCASCAPERRCAARRTRRDGAGRAAESQTAAFTTQPYDPAGGGCSTTRCSSSSNSGARRQPRHPGRSGAVDQARAVLTTSQLDRFPAAAVGAAWMCASRPIPGFSDAAGAHDDVPRRPRRVLGDRSLRRGRAVRCRQARPPTRSRRSLDDVRVLVAADVARNYFDLRGLQQQLAVAERSLD